MQIYTYNASDVLTQ